MALLPEEARKREALAEQFLTANAALVFEIHLIDIKA